MKAKHAAILCVIVLLSAQSAFAQKAYSDEYISKLDGKKRPYVVCASDRSDTPKPLIIDVSPAGTYVNHAKQTMAMIVGMASKSGEQCVALRPTGRGDGSIYMNYGERDLFEAIEDVCKKHAIDRDRIYLYGHSMGGAATWYLASHYPDFFAAAAPSAGYCDYRLWKKPGGWTFHLNEWEEPNWISRSACYLTENLEHTPVYIIHGEWDRGTGGGVDVRHARQMRDLMTEAGFPPKYLEVPEKGHGFGERFAEITEGKIRWFFEQKKERDPKHVSHVAYELRHNKAYWVSIDQFIKYGATGAKVDATRKSKNEMVVLTENVRTFSLGPIDGYKAKVVIDGQRLGKANLTKKRSFRIDEDGKWVLGEYDLSREKRRGSAGGIDDLFFEDLLIVNGTIGTAEEDFFNQKAARNIPWYYKQHNGGVHRGGIKGYNHVDIPVVSDVALTEQQRTSKNLLVIGTYKTNAILAKFADRLPLKFGEGWLEICGRRFEGRDVTAVAIFPHPENPDRYVAVHGGVTPDAISWGSHLHLGLLPDYIVYSQAEVIDWGFWGNDWREQ